MRANFDEEPAVSSTRHYSYSRYHRCLEIVSIAACVAIMGTMSWRAAEALVGLASWQSMTLVVVAGLFAYILADFVTGVVHWMADTFGSPQTPILGEAFVGPFRDHHHDPKDITRHDFVEVNGNNSVVLLMVLVPAMSLPSPDVAPTWLAVTVFVTVFSLGIFMTNQFHKWAHADEVPALVAWLQDRGLILSPEVHDLHHTAPYRTDFCITSGWLNPLLTRLNVFSHAERIVRSVAPALTSEPEASADAELTERG